jgi:hypothetical protein
MLEKQPQSQVSSVQDLKFPNPTHTQMSMCKDWMVSSTCPLWKLWTRWSSFTSPMVEVCWVPGLNVAIWSSPTSTTTPRKVPQARLNRAKLTMSISTQKNSKNIKKDQVILKLTQTYSILQLSQVSSLKRKILFSNKPWFCSRFSQGLSARANPSEPGRLDPPAEVDRYNPWKSSGWKPQNIHVSNDGPKLVPSQTSKCSKDVIMKCWLVARQWPIGPNLALARQSASL